MADLGRFGVAKPPVEEVDTFEFFDLTVRANPAFGELDLADFLEVAATVDDSDVVEAMALLKGTLRNAIMAEDFDAFWATAKRERQGVADLIGIVYQLVEKVTDRPTERPSDSSDGSQPTSTSSQAGSSSRVIARLEQTGRPDLALVVQRADESRASA